MKKFDEYNPPDDALLFASMQANDPEAFTLLYRRYHPMIYSLALFYLKDTVLAQDVVQHTFLKLWEQRHTLGVRLSVRNYLFSMAKNYVLNQIRNHQSALEKNYELTQEAPMTDEFESVLESREGRRLLYRAIDCLSAAQRRVIVYRLEEELNHQEVALRMNLSVNTVKSHYQAALKALRKLLDKTTLCVLMLIWMAK